MIISKKDFKEVYTDILAVKTKSDTINCSKWAIKDGIATIEKTNFDMFLIKNISIESDCNFCFLLPDEVLKAISKKADKKKTEYVLNVQETGIVFEGIFYSFQGLITIPIEDFPEAPQQHFSNGYLINTDDFLSVYNHASADTIKPIFNAIYIENGNVIATDSRRLSILQSNINKEFTALIPLQGIDIVKTKKVNIVISKFKSDFNADNIIKMEWSNNVLFCKEVDGQYVNYKQVIPKNEDTLHIETYNKTDLLYELKKALDTDRRNISKSIINNGTSWTSRNSERDDRYSFPIKDHKQIQEGYNFLLCVNNQYFIDAVENCPLDILSIRYYGNMSPVKIESGAFMSILMPIIIKNKEE